VTSKLESPVVTSKLIRYWVSHVLKIKRKSCFVDEAEFCLYTVLVIHLGNRIVYSKTFLYLDIFLNHFVLGTLSRPVAEQEPHVDCNIHPGQVLFIKNKKAGIVLGLFVSKPAMDSTRYSRLSIHIYRK
jgi:hypothetical protein